MKHIKFLAMTLAMAAGVCFFASCGDDDDDVPAPPTVANDKGASAGDASDGNAGEGNNADDGDTGDNANIPEGAVDLGLSVYWAKCNIGASVPEESGSYYAWGETDAKTEYSQSTSKWYEVGMGDRKAQGVVDDKSNLTSGHDVAHKALGGKWRMPTQDEMQELVDNCTTEWLDMNGVYGYRVTSRKNGNSIFLPAAGSIGSFDGVSLADAGVEGCYWCATAMDEYFSFSLVFTPDTDDYVKVFSTSVRKCVLGATIRPVSD